MAASKQTQEKQFNVQEAAAYLGVRTQRIRTLLRKGIVKGKKVPIEGTGYAPWKIAQSALDAYKASNPSGSRSGAKKYILRLTAEQYIEIAALLGEHGVTLETAAKPKTDEQKAERKRKKEAKKQQTATEATEPEDDEAEAITFAMPSGYASVVLRSGSTPAAHICP